MNNKKYIYKCLIALFLFCWFISSDIKSAYQIIEINMPGILGAILAGIIAGISIIFSILITITNSENLKESDFNGFLCSLKLDVQILLLCLVLSVFTPYFRIAGIPILTFDIFDFFMSREVFYSTVEIMVLVVSTSIIYEIFNIMFNIISFFLESNKQ